MMRRFSILILAGLALAGCEKFLDDKPTDRRLDDEAFSSLNDLYLNGVVSLYREVGGNQNGIGLQGTTRGVYDLNTFCTDEAIIPTRGADWYDGGSWQALFTHRFESADGTGDAWKYLMRQVTLCNKSLEKINDFDKEHPEHGDAVARYQAEVTALRAMFRFYAMDLYGRMPLYDSSMPTAEQLHLQPRSATFKSIVDDLQQAMTLLSYDRPNMPGEYYGRITKPVAMFLLAKLALNAEVYTDDNWTDGRRPDGKNIRWNILGKQYNTWQACIYYCRELEQFGYRLEEDRSACFAVRNDRSVENIFTIPMDKYLYSNEFWNLVRSRNYNHAAALGLNGENGPSATLHALDVFGYGTDDEDPRFQSTYYAGAVYDLNGNPVLLDDGTPLVYYPREVKLDLSDSPYIRTAGARMAKYEVDLAATKDGKLCDNDIVLMRFADVLLMHCEALLRDGKPGDEADALLNAVRERSWAPKRTATLDNVLDERLLELAWEGWRRNDLIRFDRFTTPIPDRPTLPGELDGHTIVYPIPGEPRSITGDPQNPGY